MSVRMSTYLNFSGQCREAFSLYERVLGGKITFMQTHGDSPMADQTPPEWRDAIMHATLQVGDQVLMGADAPPPHSARPQGFAVSLQLDDPDQADRIFGVLSENGTVHMPLQQTFWARRFGMFVDRFGTPWMINCE